MFILQSQFYKEPKADDQLYQTFWLYSRLIWTVRMNPVTLVPLTLSVLSNLCPDSNNIVLLGSNQCLWAIWICPGANMFKCQVPVKVLPQAEVSKRQTDLHCLRLPGDRRTSPARWWRQPPGWWAWRLAGLPTPAAGRFWPSWEGWSSSRMPRVASPGQRGSRRDLRLDGKNISTLPWNEDLQPAARVNVTIWHHTPES